MKSVLVLLVVYLSFSQTVKETNHYYAFGLKANELSVESSSNRSDYNGKEIDEDLGIIHYGARFYEPAIGRWMTTDPLNEFLTPYSYVGSDPVNYIDPDGMASELTMNDDWITLILTLIKFDDLEIGWTWKLPFGTSDELKFRMKTDAYEGYDFYAINSFAYKRSFNLFSKGGAFDDALAPLGGEGTPKLNLNISARLEQRTFIHLNPDAGDNPFKIRIRDKENLDLTRGGLGLGLERRHDFVNFNFDTNQFEYISDTNWKIQLSVGAGPIKATGAFRSDVKSNAAFALGNKMLNSKGIVGSWSRFWGNTYLSVSGYYDRTRAKIDAKNRIIGQKMQNNYNSNLRTLGF